jgi:hypothetical protein
MICCEITEKDWASSGKAMPKKEAVDTATSARDSVGIEVCPRYAASFTAHTSWPAPTDKTSWGLTVAIC